MNMWFVNVIRIVPIEQRRHYFSRWSAFRCGLRRTFRNIKIKQMFFADDLFFKFIENYQDYRNEMSPAIDVRTWGFYSSKEKAIECVQKNVTDIYENYYRWAVVESVNEGVIADVEEQVFFEWNNAAGGYIEQPSIPKEIEESDKRYHMGQFTTLG